MSRMNKSAGQRVSETSHSATTSPGTSIPASSDGADTVVRLAARSKGQASAPMSEAAFAALGDLLNEMASLACTIESLATDLTVSRESNGIEGLAALAQKIGWLADEAADAVGASQVRGGAVNWFLSHVALDALRTVEGGAA